MEKPETNTKTRGRLVIIGLVLICLFHIIHNYVWVKQEALSWYPEKYYQLFFKNTLYFSLEEIIHSGVALQQKFLDCAGLLKVTQGWGWGNLFYLYTAFVNLVFGNSIDVSVLANLPFFVLLILSTYLAGKHIAGNSAGLLSAFLVSFYPGIYGISRSYGVDFPMIALVSLCFYMLIARDLALPRNALIFGLIFGATLCIKISSLYFLAVPYIYTFWQTARLTCGIKEASRRLPMVFALCLYLGVPLLFLFLVWGEGFGVALVCAGAASATFKRQGNFFAACPYGLGDWRSLFFYAYETMQSVSRSGFLVFLVALPLFLLSRIKHKLTLILWLAVPYFILSLSVNKWGRYYFAAFAAFALISAIGLCRIKTAKIRRCFIGLVVLLLLVHFYDYSFGTRILPPMFYRHPLSSFLAYPPQRSPEARAVNALMKKIDSRGKEKKEARVVLFVAGFDLIDTGKFEYIFQVQYPETVFSKFFNASRDYKECDYIIVLNYSPASANRPDLGFLGEPGAYKKYLEIHYPFERLNEEQLKKMHDYFSKFPVVGSYVSEEYCFYLCKNIFKKDPPEKK